MESGEGADPPRIVAIVERLQDAGLTVTLIDGRREELGLGRGPSAHILALDTPQSSRAQRSCSISKKNTSAQICDGRFASSYQLAHCSMRPSSPPVNTPEFPLQKPGPSRGRNRIMVLIKKIQVNKHYKTLQFNKSSEGELEKEGCTLWGGDKTLSHHKCFVMSVGKHYEARVFRQGSNKVLTAYQQFMSGYIKFTPVSALKTVAPMEHGGWIIPKGHSPPLCNVADTNHAESGNFEIGVSSHRERPVRLRDTQSLRSSNFWNAKSSMYAQPSREMESFINSLRKYPNTSPPASPDTTLSTEMVQRLLSYAQTKNFTKSSYHSKSMRSLVRQRSPEQTNDNNQSPNKRACRKSSPTRENGSSTNDEIRNSFVTKIKSKSYKLYSPLSDSRYIRYKDNLLNSTYDYLKSINLSTHRKGGNRVTEVRYLNDMSRCIRDTLRHLYDDNPTVCPRIRNRYCQHQKDHHGRCTDLNLESNSANTEAQASLPTTSRAVTTSVPCDFPPREYRMRPKICCYCQKPLPCGCTYPSLSSDRNDSFSTIVEELISEWQKDIPVYIDESKEEKIKREKILRDLAETLKDLDDDEDKLKQEIVKALDKIPMWNPGSIREQEKFKDLIADSLLKKLDAVSRGLNRFEEDITNFVYQMPLRTRDEAGRLVDKGKIASDFVRNLKPIIVNRPEDDEEYQEAVKSKTIDMLEELPINVEVNDKIKTINNLADKLASKLKKVPPKSIGKRKKSSEEYSDGRKNKLEKDKDTIEQEIYELLEDYPEVSSNNPETKKMVKKLASKLADMKFNISDEEELEEEFEKEISHWLTDFSDKTGVTVRNQRLFSKKLSKRLKNKLQQRRRWSKLEDIQETIQKEISDILDTSPIKLSPNKKKAIEEKVTNILAKNINTVQSPRSDEIKEEISQYLAEEGIFGPEAENLANSFIERTKGIKFTKSSKKAEMSQADASKIEINDSVKAAVKNILNNSGIPMERRQETAAKLTEILTDQVMRGIDDNKTKALITSVLQNENLSPNEIEDLTNQFLTRSNEISMTLGPKRLYALKEDADEEIMNFLSNVTGDANPLLVDKRKALTEEMMSKVEKIMNDPNKSLSDKDQLIKDEVKQYLKKLSLDTDIPHEELANKLMDQIKQTSFKTSTPRSSVDRGRDFFHQTGQDITLPSSIKADENLEQATSSKSDLERQYFRQLADILHKWIEELQISINKNLKDTMVKDLATDIIDRKKYLQINPQAKTSEEEELEHLKYQVFRWLNKISDVNKLPSIMSEIKKLMDMIKNIPVPQLAGSSSKQWESIRISELDSLLKNLIEEITIWFREIPPHYYKIPDRNQHQQMIKDLAEKIYRLKELEDHHGIEMEVVQWLKMMIKDVERLNMRGTVDDLMNRLQIISVIESSYRLVQNTEQFIEENLVQAILDWLRSQQFLYQRRSSLDKRFQEQLIVELGKKLVATLDSSYPELDLEELWFHEILDHLKKFPMDAKLKFDEAFHFKIAEQLLGYIKSLQLFQDISDRFYSTNNNQLASRIEEWMEALPMNPRSSLDKKQLDNLKSQFTSIMTEIKDLYEASSSGLDEEDIKEEIVKYLKMFPIIPTKKRDLRFLSEKADMLLNIIKEIHNEKQKSIHKEVPKNEQDILYEEVEKWFDELSSHHALNPQEKTIIKKKKKDLASKLMFKIGELNTNPDVLQDDFIYQDLLQKKIDQLLSTLPINDKVEKEMPRFVDKLVDKLKVAKKKIQNEQEGRIYKQKLRETISKSLPLNEDLSSEDKAAFELLKENLADDFINLHYVAEDADTRRKYKEKINQEIKTFCNKYLRRSPAAPINSEQLNRDLYNALKRVSIPADESMLSEVDELKIKDVINDWMKDLQINIDTEQKKAEVNKLVTSLAKHLHKMELEKDYNPNINYDELFKDEINRFIKKLPVETERQADKMKAMADKLAEKLKSTENTRRKAVVRRSVDSDGVSDSSHINMCPYYKMLMEQVCDNGCLSHHSTKLPSSSLTTEDKALLLEIRQRSQGFAQKHDVSVSPLPMDGCSQTEVYPRSQLIEPNNSSRSMQLKVVCPNSGQDICSLRNDPNAKAPCSANGSREQQLPISPNIRGQANISPNVIINEHPWISADSLHLQGSGRLPCASPCKVQKGYTTPCPLPRCAPRTPSCQTLNRSPCVITPRRYYDKPQPCPGRRNISNCSSPIECTSYRPMACRRPRVIRHSCIEQAQCSGALRMIKSRERFLETDWTDSDFMSPCKRRAEMRSDDDYVEIRMRGGRIGDKPCKCNKQPSQNTCRSRLPRCFNSSPSHLSCDKPDTMKSCSRCCGAHCPYPSYLYFKP